MTNLARVKTRFTVVVAVLAVANLILIGYLLWPGSSPSAKLAKEQALMQQQAALKKDVAPLEGIEGKLAKTRVDVKNFYAQKVPSEFSQISQQLEKIVQDTGVSTQSGIRYSQDRSRDEKSDLPDVQRIAIEATVTGEYSKVARFINALEQDRYLFIINQITVNGAEGGSVVSLQIKFETFLKQT
ncbi:MAG TPA: GspMb/PilO family protein [Candidatus Angelobacter sp.]|nr:GspMb/PilO family protein [Candidatus Angelobacter sp.]